MRLVNLLILFFQTNLDLAREKSGLTKPFNSSEWAKPGAGYRTKIGHGGIAHE